ncbi:hypothetical protein [Aquaspirillum serpens]|uniref:hypothetical protein n=1 Tax=Aquaspirillum serpens TaxID=190 RepID=UPI0003B6EE69|nr:hypothetical protein [Aquaspirillum serpens]
MSKNKIGLDKKDQTRLTELTDSWNDAVPAWACDKEMTAADLRLLLENFAPLQNLIRSLVAEAVDGHTQTYTAPHLPETHAQTGNSDLAQQREHQYAQQQWAQDRQKLQNELQQCKDKLDECQEQLQRANSVPAELAFLRRDRALAKALGLTDLPDDDTQALIRMVAVLSSPDDVSRLWSALKDRCEADNRPIDAEERALLHAAVTWLNHNWPNLPYQLIDVAANTPFLFDNHIRFKHTPTGETVAQMYLPTFADSKGVPVNKNKAVVGTR